MFHTKDRTIYYISNLGTGKVSIIDGNSLRIIKEVDIGSRPQDIIVDEEDNIYIASDRNNRVTLIQDLYDTQKSWDIPNNGSMEVDLLAQKIYVCNTTEIGIYQLKTGKKLDCITGFTCANNLKLDKEKKRLFVLDILCRDIKVYDTIEFHQIKHYRDIGSGPCDMLLELNGKYLYISNKGSRKKNDCGNIAIVNMESEDTSYIDFPIGSILTSLEQNENYIFAANIGLHRIEVIDILGRRCIATIKTTLPLLQKLRFSRDFKILYAISLSHDGKGVVDQIDPCTYAIINTLIIEKNHIPYDIGVITPTNPQVNNETYVIADLPQKWKRETGTTILAKKVLSMYQEKVMFKEVSIEVPIKEKERLDINTIRFQKSEMIDETKNIKMVDHQKECFAFTYKFYIPYYISNKGEQEGTYVIRGQMEGSQRATLYIPSYTEQQKVEFIVSSYTQLVGSPVIKNNKLVFSASAVISTKAIVDEIVFI